MYACLHRSGSGPEEQQRLVELAYAFAPVVEIVDPETVVFPITGLRRLIGEPPQIAAEIARRGSERGIHAQLAIARTPDTAILAAKHLPGVTLIPPGREVEVLESIPIERISLPPKLLEVLQSWGIHTIGEFAALPLAGLAERLGPAAVELYLQVHGRLHRPLRVQRPEPEYVEEQDLEEPLHTLEPLLFLLGQMLQQLCSRLCANFLAAGQVGLELQLERGLTYHRTIELAMPQAESKPLLKLLQLALETHPPSAPIRKVRLWLRPVQPRTVQEGLFYPPAPEPQKLQLTLARLAKLVGSEQVGSPELLNTHRPDAFRLRPFAPPRFSPSQLPASPVAAALRRFRPPLPARVSCQEGRPHHVAARRITGMVLEAAGPWRSSGDWWAETRWARDEWDVALTSGGTYRIYQELASKQWFVDGVYD